MQSYSFYSFCPNSRSKHVEDIYLPVSKDNNKLQIFIFKNQNRDHTVAGHHLNDPGNNNSKSKSKRLFESLLSYWNE